MMKKGKRMSANPLMDIGHPHRNPDGKEVGPKHLHLYREGYNNLQWAYEIPKSDFSDLDDIYKTIKDFLQYIHVVNIPEIQKGLFNEQY